MIESEKGRFQLLIVGNIRFLRRWFRLRSFGQHKVLLQSKRSFPYFADRLRHSSIVNRVINKYASHQIIIGGLKISEVLFHLGEERNLFLFKFLIRLLSHTCEVPFSINHVLFDSLRTDGVRPAAASLLSTM